MILVESIESSRKEPERATPVHNVEVINSADLAKRWGVSEIWIRNQTRPSRTTDPIPFLRLAKKPEKTMTQAQYQKGSLYKRSGAWHARYREQMQQDDGSILSNDPALCMSLL
jgi:hypothetical protein